MPPPSDDLSTPLPALSTNGRCVPARSATAWQVPFADRARGVSTRPSAPGKRTDVIETAHPALSNAWPRIPIAPASPPTWTVSPIRYDDPSVQPLLLQLHVAQVQTYGFADDPADTPANEYTPPDGPFLLSRDAPGQAAGCGGWRLLDPRTAEIKRMYVRPDARGKSLGRQILLRLEADAQLHGVTHIKLETGVANLAALCLYRSHGYQPIEPYRPGRNPAVNRALRKTLQGTPAP